MNRFKYCLDFTKSSSFTTPVLFADSHKGLITEYHTDGTNANKTQTAYPPGNLGLSGKLSKI